MELTKNEAYAIAELIDVSLIDYIRNDTDLDSLYWLSNVIRGFEKLCSFSGFSGLSYPNERE